MRPRRRRVQAAGASVASLTVCTSDANAAGSLHGKIGEDLAVDLDAGRLQPVDEPRVRQAVRPDGGVDPRDPQSAELALRSRRSR